MTGFLRVLLAVTIFTWSATAGRSDNIQNSEVPQAPGGKRKLIGIVVEETKVGVGIPVGIVVPHSPAEKAGIKAGDIITKLDGESMVATSSSDFIRRLAQKDVHTLEVESKDGAIRTTQIGMVNELDLKPLLNLGKIDVGQTAPDFEAAPSADAPRIKLSDLRGRPVLILFTASWCGPCRLEAPKIKTLHEQYKDRVRFISVYLDDAQLDVFAYARGLGVDWPISTDGKGLKNTVAKSYGVIAVPSYVLVGRNGSILNLGTVIDSDLAPLLDHALR